MEPDGILALERWQEVSGALASAFADDPVFSWLLPDERRRPAALARFFALEARRIVLRHGDSRGRTGAAGLLGAALVLPPGRWRTPLRVQALYGPQYASVFGRRLPRALGVLTELERRHPRDPHVFFPYIGVVPAAQGQGVGSALLAPVLERCDREGLPVYLEASSPRSARLYERLGFVATEEIEPLGAPPIRLMRRAAAPRGR